MICKKSRRVVILDRRNYFFKEFRDRAVLADYLGVAHETVTGWFRVQENGKKPKTKMYNNLEIINIDEEYSVKQNKEFGGKIRSPGDDSQ